MGPIATREFWTAPQPISGTQQVGGHPSHPPARSCTRIRRRAHACRPGAGLGAVAVGWMGRGCRAGWDGSLGAFGGGGLGAVGVLGDGGLYILRCLRGWIWPGGVGTGDVARGTLGTPVPRDAACRTEGVRALQTPAHDCNPPNPPPYPCTQGFPPPTPTRTLVLQDQTPQHRAKAKGRSAQHPAHPMGEDPHAGPRPTGPPQTPPRATRFIFFPFLSTFSLSFPQPSASSPPGSPLSPPGTPPQSFPHLKEPRLWKKQKLVDNNPQSTVQFGEGVITRQKNTRIYQGRGGRLELGDGGGKEPCKGNVAAGGGGTTPSFKE